MPLQKNFFIQTSFVANDVNFIAETCTFWKLLKNLYRYTYSRTRKTFRTNYIICRIFHEAILVLPSM